MWRHSGMVVVERKLPESTGDTSARGSMACKRVAMATGLDLSIVRYHAVPLLMGPQTGADVPRMECILGPGWGTSMAGSRP